jgi:thiamine monophosphate synthase
MKTYIARIQTSSGTHTIKLSASSLEEATAALQSRARATASGPVNYTIQEQAPLESPQLVAGLMNATSMLFVCLAVLVVADYKLRKWLKR